MSALEDETRAFYDTHAESFSDTRQTPWGGWFKLASMIPKGPGSILDVGCGNGRFLSFLREQGFDEYRYVGMDQCEPLLDLARQSHVGDPKAEFGYGEWSDVVMHPARFDVVACFGVLHHVPGNARRLREFARLAQKVRDGGLLLVSIWQPLIAPMAERKFVQTDRFGELEHNDFLMGWSGDSSVLRYCHHCDDPEVRDLVRVSGLSVVADFYGETNDRSNRYLVLQN